MSGDRELTVVFYFRLTAFTVLISALKASEKTVSDLEEKRRKAEEEALAIQKQREEAEARRIAFEEEAEKNKMEKEEMVRFSVYKSDTTFSKGRALHLISL